MEKLTQNKASIFDFKWYHRTGLMLTIPLLAGLVVTPTQRHSETLLSLMSSNVLYSSKDTDEDYCLKHPSCKKLAEAVFFESRGEPKYGQYLVAYVIMNRVDDKKQFPNTVEGVVDYKRRGICHFSYVCHVDNKLFRISQEYVSYRSSLKVAYDVYFSQNTIYFDADHFYNRTIVGTPSWAKNMAFVGRIGNHWFYNSKGDM